MADRHRSVMLVDGYSLIYRAFHALPLLTSGGVYTNAVHGFFSMLFKAIADYKPDCAIVMMDVHAPTFRHSMYEEYKATRKPTPEELLPQFPIVRELLAAMDIPIMELEGYEADDLLGTAARLAGERGLRAYVLTGDRDSLQLAGGSTEIILTKTGISESLLLDAQGVYDQFGYTPSQVPDLKGLMGDSSDNIPGVAGIGEKTALKLLKEYGTLDEALSRAGEIKGKLGQRLVESRDAALLSRDLGTIRTSAPIKIDFSALTLDHISNGLPVFEKYHMRRLAQTLSELHSSGETKERAETVTAPGPEATVIDSEAGMEALAREIAGCEGLALHIGEAVTLSAGDKMYSFPIAQGLMGGGLYVDAILRALSPALARPLTVHGAKAVFALFDGFGLPLPEIEHDTLMGAYLLRPNQKSYALPPEADAHYVRSMAQSQREELYGMGMLGLLTGMEQPLTKVLYEMEREGFGLDRSVLLSLGAQFSAEIARLRSEVYELTGVSGFNLNSPKQLGEVLFETLKLPYGKKSKTGAYSTDAEVLEGLAPYHPAIEPLLSYRQLVKLNGTYIDGLLKQIDAGGRVHTTFDQTSTLTGRISSLEPNLQNIPVRTQQGREIRRAFVAGEGRLLLDADYSQIELRVLAHLSGDPAMLDAFQKGQDIHTRTASEIFGTPLDMVTPDMRRSAKAVNFGIVYGISAFGLARNTGVSRKEAEEFISRYFERYPLVKKYMDDMAALAHERGYAETMFGRRREIPELTSQNRSLRAFGERAAMNTPVQGTAADIIKLAMVRVRDALIAGGYGAKLILQVHDELVVECPENEAEPVSALLRSCMEDVARLKAPLVAEVSRGKNWYDAH